VNLAPAKVLQRIGHASHPPIWSVVASLTNRPQGPGMSSPARTGGPMRQQIRSLIYQKWFYAFLAVVLWFDCWTDVADVIEAFSTREVISLIGSTTGATLVTLIFFDLHLRWPPKGR